MSLAKLQLVVQDEHGEILDGAEITIRDESDNSLASLFSDVDGLVPIGNPYTADDGADAGCYVAGGTYRIDIEKDDFSRPIRHWQVGFGTVTEIETDYPIGGGPITAAGVLNWRGPTTAGLLARASATALEFKPKNGDLIRIEGVVYQIPAAGIAGVANTGVYVNGVSNQSLGANTNYYVFAFDPGTGVVTADFRTDGNGHKSSTTSGNIGTEVRVSSGTTEDDSRTLIGFIRTNASSQFADSATQRFVLSWFNRRCRTATQSGGGGTRTLSSYAVIGTDKIEFLTWGDESTALRMSGYVSHTASGSNIFTSASVDGSTVAPEQVSTAGGNNHSAAMSVSYVADLSEGYHYLELQGKTSASTATWTNPRLVAEIRG